MGTDFFFFFLRRVLQKLLVCKGTYDEKNGGNTWTQTKADKNPEIQDTAQGGYVGLCGRVLLKELHQSLFG